MAFRYVDVRDAQQHLSGSVVMYDGLPAYVIDIQNHPTQQGAFIATIAHLPRIRNGFQIDLFDGRLDVRGIRLGYTNTDRGRATFLTRIPARQYKQGLCRQNVNIPRERDGQRFINFEGLLQLGAFSDALRGIYPTYEEAVNLLENPETRSVAFNREFALEKDELGFLRLYYRGDPVAFGENKNFRLANKYGYLKEQITELGVVVS